jgi:putative addiction module component (TIGR02574 family)
MNITNIKNMSTIERLQVMEEIWDSFTFEKSDLESPEWHKKILNERRANIAGGKANFITLDELKNIAKR